MSSEKPQQTRSVGWRETKLWSEISNNHSDDAEATRAVLTLHLPLIEKILAVGGTSPLDFTLHDASHAFRVANRMAEIIPKDVLTQLSVYELALLLLAAYLHDIGMTPERRLVESVYKFLLTGDRDGPFAEEQKELEKWLDENHPDVTRPLDFRTNPEESRLQGNELVTDYCRHRHNDWSEKWIKENLSSSSLGTYSGWVTDLVTLCRSHHEGYPELQSSRFEPRYVGAPPVMVHLRYLAASLRVADVLELDPERTPNVILRHRGIRPSSLIYWWKDAEISIKQEAEGLSVYARPENARIHKAVETTVEQINAELLTCKKLADLTHFEVCPASATKLSHRWALPPVVSDNVRPRDNSYDYIDGSFRPDTRKLLQLLSGVELYGDKMAAVRELLQNGFDAVREEIAYVRLTTKGGASEAVHERLAELNSVELRIEFSAEGTWLICKDTGVGMTKSIIRDHLLVSGTGTRHDVLELERRCNRAGFHLGRTGQFGIGVLSYFMLADQVIIRTKRSQFPGDSESNGWYFETEGVGSFGELRQDMSIAKGTEIRLRLKSDKSTADPQKLYRVFLDYIKTTILRIPCRFSLSSNAAGCPALELSPGFTPSDDDLRKLIAQRIGARYHFGDETPTELLSKEKRLQREDDEKHLMLVRQECEQHLQFDHEEGEILGGLGHYRIHLPHFEYSDGASLAFIRPSHKEKQVQLEKVGQGYCHLVENSVTTAWKGMSLSGYDFRQMMRHDQGSRREMHGCLLEVDWNSIEAGTISVSRNSLDQTGMAAKSLRWLSLRCSELQSKFLDKNKKSLFNILNSRLVEAELPQSTHLNWIKYINDDGGRKAVWGTVRPPFLNALAFQYHPTEHLSLKWNSKNVSIAASLPKSTNVSLHSGLAWCGPTNPPEMVVALLGGAGVFPSFGLSPFWATDSLERPSTHVVGLTCDFPPEWNHLCGANFKMYSSHDESAIVWNRANLFVNYTNATAWNWCKKVFSQSLDPLPHKSMLLNDRGKAASWVILCLERGQWEIWDGLKDRDHTFLEGLWATFFGETNKTPRNNGAVYQWVEDSTDSRLRILTPEGWVARRLYDSKGLRDLLPIPSSAWCVSVTDERYSELTKTPRRR